MNLQSLRGNKTIFKLQGLEKPIGRKDPILSELTKVFGDRHEKYFGTRWYLIREHLKWSAFQKVGFCQVRQW